MATSRAHPRKAIPATFRRLNHEDIFGIHLHLGALAEGFALRLPATLDPIDTHCSWVAPCKSEWSDTSPIECKRAVKSY
jgi:hypothetical protein